MYESFFGLKRRPFAATPDPQCFLASGSMQAALDEIVVCIEQGQGIAIVSAPAGTGKTLLCERLRSELGSSFESVLLRHASFLTRRALLQTILCELSHAYRQQDEQELRLELMPAIRALRPQREALVLICDEAHQLSEELLEELRILSDLAEQGRPLVRLVLVGQLGLEETLARPGMEALNQRIRAHVCLETLDRAGSLDYIDYRLTWAGGRTEEVFSAEALDLVSRAADGVPRCLNQLCDHALLLAYVAEQQPVPPAIIREALQDLRQLPLHWNETATFDPARRNSVSVESDADIAAIESNAQLTEFSYEDRPAHEGLYNVESIEIGADLPRAVSRSIPQPDQRLESSHVGREQPLVQTTVNVIGTGFETGFETGDDRTGDETFHADHFSDELLCDEEEETSGDAFTTRATNHVETELTTAVPACVDPLAGITILAARPPKQSGFTEELVLDRYAAIDAGLEPVDVEAVLTLEREAAALASQCVAPALKESASTACDTTTHFETIQNLTTVEVGATTDSAEDDHAREEIHATVVEAVMTEPVDQGSNATEADHDFQAACARLHERLPQVADETAWDSNLLQDGSVAESYNDTSHASRDDDDKASMEAETLEEVLGAEVCELVQQLQHTMGLPARPHSSVAQLRSLLTAKQSTSDSMVSYEASATEFVAAACDRPVTKTHSQMESVPAATETSARPYRNLFSILRRKQQGL